MGKRAYTKKKTPDIEPVPPSSLFDSIEIADDVDLADSHSLKRSLMTKDAILSHSQYEHL
jgi:hypothetical protein